MTTAELLLGFRLAEKQGFIPDLYEEDQCSGKCTNCPASAQCTFLVHGETYKTFQKNYNKSVIPYIEQYTLEYLEANYPELFL